LSRRHVVADDVDGERGLVLWDVRIRPDGLVLPVDEHPEPDLVLLVLEEVGYPSFKRGIGFGFENTERMKFGRRPILVVEACEVEPLVGGEGLVRDDLRARSATALRESTRTVGDAPWP
jgi:hypothetical protein